MTRTTRRTQARHAFPTWAAPLWGLALLSLLLLPSNYRADGDVQHGHSVFQLWADAADGRVAHHHALAGTASVSVTGDWFDPLIETTPPAPATTGVHGPDVPEYEDSAPALGGVHLLLVSVTVVLAVVVARNPTPRSERSLSGQVPRVLAPPPRPSMAGARLG